MKYLKDGGGTKGLQQDGKEVIEIAKPEVLRYLDEFWLNIRSNDNESTEHSDSSISEQKFIKYLTSMLQVVEDGKIVNPFDTNEEELITLSTSTDTQRKGIQTCQMQARDVLFRSNVVVKWHAQEDASALTGY